MTTKKKSSWSEELQEAAAAGKSKAKDNPTKVPTASTAQPVLDDIRVIVRDARMAGGPVVHPIALRMPVPLITRLDHHIAGQRHAAILALIEYGLDELIRQKKVLEVK